MAVAAALQPARSQVRLGLYLAAALLAVNEWGLRRLMELARSAGAAWGLRFGAWHGVSALLYGGACLAALRY